MLCLKNGSIVLQCQSQNIHALNGSATMPRRPRRPGSRAARMSRPSLLPRRTPSLRASPSQPQREGLLVPNASPASLPFGRHPLSVPTPVSRPGERTPCAFRLSGAWGAPFSIFSFQSYKKYLTKHTKRHTLSQKEKLTTQKRAAVLRCLIEGMSIRATSRITGTAKNTARMNREWTL